MFERSGLEPGTRLQGPAIIEEPTSTTVVEPEDALEVNPQGYLIIHIGGGK